MSEVILKPGETVERALRRLKKRIDREGTLKEARNRRHYEKPSRKRYREMRRKKYNQRIRSIEEHKNL
jgi:small subunit ribosomal protein S21